MKRRRWRGLLLALATLVAAFLFLLYSESGLRFGVFMLTEVMLKPLSVNEVRGRLAGPFTLNGIEYQDGQRHLTLASLSLDWKPAALLTDTLHITDLKGSELHFEQLHKPEDSSGEKSATLPTIKLPIRLVLDSATVDGIDIKSDPETVPVSIRQIAIQADTHRDTIQFRSLRLESELYRLEARGKLRPVENYELTLDLNWRVLTADGIAWQGQGTLAGDLLKLDIRQSLSAPFNADMTLSARDLLNGLSWDGVLSIPHLKSSQLPYPISPAFSAGVDLEASGEIDTFTATGTFAGEVEQLGAIEGNLKTGYADQRLELNRLEIIRPKTASRVEASGDIELTEPLRYRLQANWESLAWPLDSELIRSERGQLAVSGEAQRYRLSSDFQLRGAHIPKGMWRLQGSGDREAFAINTLEGKLLDGTVSGHVTLALTPPFNWQGEFEGRKLDPSAMWPEWPGVLDLDTTISGELSEQGPAIAITLSSLKGTLRERPVKGQTGASWRGGVASIKALQLQVGTARLQAEGTIGDKWMISAQLDAPDLHDLLPQGQGRLKATGTLSGPRMKPGISLQLEGGDLSLGDTRADSLLADIELDLQDRRPSHVILQLNQLQLPGFEQQSATLTVRGPLSAHKLTLEARNDKQSLKLEADAGYIEQRWAGTVTALQIEDSSAGHWGLAEPTAFSWRPTEAHLDEFCLEQDGANLCAVGRWNRRGLTGDLRSVRFPLMLLAPYLPQRFNIEGKLESTASLNIPHERPPTIEAKLTVGEGRLHHLDPLGEKVSIAFQNLVLQLDSGKGGNLQGELSFTSNEINKAALNLQTSLAEGWPDDLMQHPLKARLRLSLHDPEFISNFTPELQNVKGAIDADVRLSGVLAAPQLSGTARFSDGRVEVPRMGLKISQIQLSATGDNTRQMDIIGQAHSGEGELSLNGRLRPLETGRWALELAMKGEEFEVARIPEARVQVSPDLTVQIVGREIHLEGELVIPSARLEPRDISLAVRPSKDVVIVGRDEIETEKARWLIHTRVRTIAEDSIRFIGYGFNGRIGGELLLIDEPGSLTKARGQLHAVPGSSYKSFGKELTIEQGRINFADSPLDNPNLDIRASRTIGDVTAGVQVSGTALNPVLTLYSEPPMDQADILSYLTLGHPVSSASQSEGEALAGAANSAGLVGGNYLAGYLGRQFGLEEARVETAEDSQSPWVVAGKYLSPRLYVRYGVGVYEDAYSVLVRYQLSEHWQVQGEGGLHSGGDIIYTFERP